jgi:peptidyl-tRNA hydrolase
MGVDRLYVITRRDLKRGLKIAQACHAAFESPRKLKFSNKSIPYMIVLEVEDEERLTQLKDQAAGSVTVVCFQEPDLDNQLTAIAFLGNDKTEPLTEGLRLAG